MYACTLIHIYLISRCIKALGKRNMFVDEYARKAKTKVTEKNYFQPQRSPTQPKPRTDQIGREGRMDERESKETKPTHHNPLTEKWLE